jgi:hypothetical protein
MATATMPPTRSRQSLEQARSEVRHPLDRVRKYIRAYVSLEGAALCLTYLALWFWIGVLLDYGFFKLFTVDWVQDLPWGVRAGLLIILSAGLLAAVVLTVVLRLVREFSDPAVALVLERRFPGQLGDRLITAVELSDPQKAAEYGYSQDMVRQTIHDAADRVGRVPVAGVFDWKRLYRRGWLVVVLTLVAYLLCGLGFVAAKSVTKSTDSLGGYTQLNDVATIWFERNVLLRNTIWPRRSYLEVLNYGDELRIPKETAPPALRVRAWEYVLADAHAPEGWRLLAWNDLEKPFLLNEPPPAPPEDWAPRDPNVGLTVDEVKLRLAQFEVRKSPEGGGELPARWNIPSARNESGWRPMEWADLTKERLGGLEVPGLPGEWDPKAWPVAGASEAGLAAGLAAPWARAARRLAGPKYIRLSVDQVEDRMKELEGKGRLEKDLGKERAAALRAVFARLERLVELRAALEKADAKVTDPALRRTVRRLIIPDAVTLVYKGRSATNTNTLQRVADNEYTGNFSELKESVTFTVRGEDYITPSKAITVVDLPRLERLVSEEERPAYLYYRVAEGGDPGALRGKRQAFEGVQISVQGGDTSLVEVPAGTSLTLTATTTKPLEKVALVREAKGKRRVTPLEVRGDDRRTFGVRLDDVRQEQRFTFEFTDTDGVLGKRGVRVAAREDTPPRVREFGPDEIIRRTKEGYVVTAAARIPFRGKVRDDHGLGRVRYAYTVLHSDFLAAGKERARSMVMAVPLVAPGTGTRLLAVGYLTMLEKETRAAEKTGGPAQYLEIPAFAGAVRGRKLDDGREEHLSLATVRRLLPEAQKEPFRKLLSEFSITPDEWMREFGEDVENPRRWAVASARPVEFDLPLWEVRYRGERLKESDESKVQKRYNVEVWLEAEDTDVEGEVGKDGKPRPHVTPSGEKFTFVVVPESELLSKIAEEEEVKYRELLKALKPLPDRETQLSDVSLELSSGSVPATALAALQARLEAIEDVVRNSQADAKSAASTYDRIVKEMRANQVNTPMITKVYETIARPLGEVDGRHFPRTLNAIAAMRKALDAQDRPASERVASAYERSKEAKREMAELIAKLNSVIAAMESLGSINDLVQLLVTLEQAEEKQYDDILRLRKEIIDKVLKGGK